MRPVSRGYKLVRNSVAKGSKFLPKNTKGAEKNLWWGRENLRPNTWQNCHKGAEKGPNFLVSFGLVLKQFYFRQKIVTSL
jgi:hypothetical protein